MAVDESYVPASVVWCSQVGEVRMVAADAGVGFEEERLALLLGPITAQRAPEIRAE